jgi:hypothetical protein
MTMRTRTQWIAALALTLLPACGREDSSPARATATTGTATAATPAGDNGAAAKPLVPPLEPAKPATAEETAAEWRRLFPNAPVPEPTAPVADSDGKTAAVRKVEQAKPSAAHK